MSYIVLEFSDGVLTVPNIWLVEDERRCLWPPTTNQEKLNKLIKERAMPDIKWTLYKVLKIHFRTDDYNQAVKREEWLLDNTDCEAFSERESNSFRSGENELKTKMRKRHRTLPSSESDDDDRTTLQPLPKPPTPKNLNSLTRPASLEVGKSSGKEKDVNVLILHKINKLIKAFEAFQENTNERLTEIEKRISGIEVKLGDKHVTINHQTSDVIENILPLKNENDLQIMEDFIKKDMATVVHVLSAIGGTTEQDVVNRMLKKLLTDELAEKFTWKGHDTKKKFCDLILPTAILKTLRCHHENATEAQVADCISKFLKYAKQRKERKLKSFLADDTKKGESEGTSGVSSVVNSGPPVESNVDDDIPEIFNIDDSSFSETL